jgi:outer membrane immunogenic protein
MKKLALAVSAVAALSGQALAADMPMKAARPAPQPVAVANWTGCYISGGLGYGLWDQENTSYVTRGATRVAVTGEWDAGGRGWLGRAGAGCDYQFGGIGSWNMVIGVFGDYDWANLHGRPSDPFTRGVGTETLSSQWAIGGRIGLLVTPQLLTYFSGGYTEANFDAISPTWFNTAAPQVLTGAYIPAATYKGWFLGSGLEYTLGWAPGLTLKTEYRLSEFDVGTNRAYFNNTNILTGNEYDSRKFVQTVTTSLVYKFNWGKSPVGKSPVVAKY